MSTYPGQCVTVANVTFSHPGGGTGVAQAFQYRYEFNTIRLFGLNDNTTYLLMTRPLGTASLVHTIISGINLTRGSKSRLVGGCVQGGLTVSAPGFSITINNAILVRTEGRVSIESFSFNDVATYVFFEYT